MKSILSHSFILLIALILPTTASSTQQPAHNQQTVKFESDSFIYWLHFRQNPDQVWKLLKQFWEKEGIALDRKNRALGFMQTEWINDPDKDIFHSIFQSDKEPEFRERFRVRVEADADNNGSRVYIYHSSYGILFDEEAVYTGYLPPSPELEIEMLNRLAIFSGADKQKFRQSVRHYKPVKLKAVYIDQNQYEILMPGSITFVSKKLQGALDRLNLYFTLKANDHIIASSTDPSALIDKNIEKVREEWGIDDSSDLEDEGFDYNPDENRNQAEEENRADIYSIHLSSNKSHTAIRISLQGDSNKDKLKTFSDAVARNLNR